MIEARKPLENDRNRSLILLAIVVLAVLMRLPSLLNDGLWRDEANVYFEVSAPTFIEFLHRTAAIEWHPPLYFFIAYLWSKVGGTGEFALKVLPFAFSILTVPFVYRLGKTASSTAAGLLAAAMYAVAPAAIVVATDYLYPMVTLLYTVLAWLVTLGRREPLTPVRYGLVALATLVVVYSHYTALLYVPLLVLWALTSPKGLRHGLGLASALIAGTIPFVLWLHVFLNEWHTGLP